MASSTKYQRKDLVNTSAYHTLDQLQCATIHYLNNIRLISKSSQVELPSINK